MEASAQINDIAVAAVSVMVLFDIWEGFPARRRHENLGSHPDRGRGRDVQHVGGDPEAMREADAAGAAG